jgi:DNA-binding NarL/FixJ family response regulator
MWSRSGCARARPGARALGHQLGARAERRDGCAGAQATARSLGHEAETQPEWRGAATTLATGAIDPEGRVRVLVADRDPLARRTVRQALGADGGFAIVAEAADGPQAVAAALRTRPDVVLIDADLPPANGIQATRRILREAPAVRVVILAMTEDAELAVLGFRAGASGFLTKDLELAGLGRALRAVLRGEATVSRRLALDLIERVRQSPARVTGMRPVHSALTPRQWEVLDLLSVGDANEEIAEQLGLSVGTARTHVRNILRKLGVPTRAQAVEVAERLRQSDERTRERFAADERQD